MIEFDNVTKVYNDDTVAIEDVSFVVEEGTTTVLVGPSGCGKTTTMELVNKLENPTEGTIYFEGTNVNDIGEIDLRRKIGYVIQNDGLFEHMSVKNNISVVPNLLKWENERIEKRVNELLELMDLPPNQYLNQYPLDLSGGQRQRIGVARALAADPPMMLMDEPFGALDPITRENLQNGFLEIQEEINTTILFVTHDINEALKMGDQVIIYNDGKIVQHAEPKEILRQPENEFVRNFIGEGREYKILQVTTAEELLQENNTIHDTRNTISDNMETESVRSNGGESRKIINSSTNLQECLTNLIRSKEEELPVARHGEIIGTISEKEVRKVIQEMK